MKLWIFVPCLFCLLLSEHLADSNATSKGPIDLGPAPTIHFEPVEVQPARETPVSTEDAFDRAKKRLDAQIEYKRNSNVLYNLEPISVTIGGSAFDKNRLDIGFYRESFMTDVELRLRQFGIEPQSPLTTEQHLIIVVNVLKRGDDSLRGLYCYSVVCTLGENVALMRNICTNGDIPFVSAITWEGSAFLGFAPETMAANKMRASVRDLVDEFINEYLAANPQKSRDVSEPKLHLRRLEDIPDPNKATRSKSVTSEK